MARADVLAPLVLLETWIECAHCGQCWQLTPARIGVFHAYVDRCLDCRVRVASSPRTATARGWRTESRSQ